MSAFTGNTTSPLPSEDIQPILKNDDWWPDIDMQAMRAQVRILGDVTDERLLECTRIAVLDVNVELKDWKAAQCKLGYTNLEQVPAESVDGKSGWVFYYLRAVFHTVDADLVEQYLNFDTTGTGDKRADELKERKATARRNKRWAISRILQISKVKVGLL